MSASLNQVQEQAQAIANVAQAIADGTLTASTYGAVLKLEDMLATLKAWTADDRPFGSSKASGR